MSKFSKSKHRLHVAMHEAGHMVIGYVLDGDRHVEWAKLFHDGRGLTQSRYCIEPYDDLVVDRAGIEAEMIILGDDVGGSHRDWLAFQETLISAFKARGHRKVARLAIKQAHAMVTMYRSAIIAVAFELLKHRKISGAHFRRIMRLHKMPKRKLKR
jgi:ATP-dependent Zn protease